VRLHAVKALLLHSELESWPLRAALFDIVRVWRVAGNEVGSGAWKLFPSRCSSVRAEREEIPEGMVPVNPSPVKSNEIRDDCRVLLDTRSGKGLPMD